MSKLRMNKTDRLFYWMRHRGIHATPKNSFADLLGSLDLHLKEHQVPNTETVAELKEAAHRRILESLKRSCEKENPLDLKMRNEEFLELQKKAVEAAVVSLENLIKTEVQKLAHENNRLNYELVALKALHSMKNKDASQ